LRAEQREFEKAEDSEDIEKVIPEIQMLKFVLFLVRWKPRNNDRPPHHSSHYLHPSLPHNSDIVLG
jgi:hypothetical protein